MILEKLQELLSEQFGVDSEIITEKTMLVDDLGADSLDLVEFMMMLEEEFDIGEIDEKIAREVVSVGDVIRLIGEDAE